MPHDILFIYGPYKKKNKAEKERKNACADKNRQYMKEEKIAEIIVRTMDTADRTDGFGADDTNAPVKKENSSAGKGVIFGVEHMMLLLKAYDAYCKVEDALVVIAGDGVREEGLLGQLSYLNKLVHDLSPLGKIEWEEEQDYYDTPLAQYLEAPEMDLRERAEKLLCVEA